MFRNQIWDYYIGQSTIIGWCFAGCDTPVIFTTFKYGFLIPETKGGEETIENIRPICEHCKNKIGCNYGLEEWMTINNINKSMFWDGLDYSDECDDNNMNGNGNGNSNNEDVDMLDNSNNLTMEEQYEHTIYFIRICLLKKRNPKDFYEKYVKYLRRRNTYPLNTKLFNETIHKINANPYLLVT